MPQITLEQALFDRPDHQAPLMRAHSPGFDDAWLAEAEHLILGFGDRYNGLNCPLAVFAKPISARHVAVVRVRDIHPGPLPTGLRFHFLVVSRKVYEEGIRDPFHLAERIEPTWEVEGVAGAAGAAGALPALMIPESSFAPRTLAQVQEVLKRVKAAALREGEDPEAPDFERTAENSESPALLGGTQILVDGGRLIFERTEGDLRLIAGLWLLLPEMTRCRRWPTSFAFSAELEFDVLVVPQRERVNLENYTTEEQAAAYPEGAYEFALQHAAEEGDQRDLDAVFRRRDGHHTVRLAIVLLLLVSALVLISRWLDSDPMGWPSARMPVPQQKAAAAAGIIAVGEPWTALGMLAYGKSLWSLEP